MLLLAGWGLLALAQRVGASNYPFARLSEEIQALQRRYPRLIQVSSIGQSVQGRELWLITLTDLEAGPPEAKPALFVAGNLEGHHVSASAMVLGIARQLAESWSRSDSVRELLGRRTFYLLPRANPDGAEQAFGPPRWEQTANLLPWDEDFDDSVDEDGPEDLNGDGWITQIRVPDPDGDYIADPEDSRVLRRIDRAKGEVGQYKVYLEGIDNDGDGQYNEDGPGGIHLDRNFPHAYPYHQPGAGRYQLQAPEARAIVDFLLAHRNVAAVLSFCLHDNLLSPPQSSRQATEAREREEVSPPPGVRGPRRPRQPATTVHPEDAVYFQRAAHVFRTMLGAPEKSLLELPKPEGAFYEWAYFHYGVPSFATPGWYPSLEETRPSGPDTARGDGGNQREVERRRPTRPVRQSSEASQPSPDLQWLRWLERCAGGAGFLSWTPFRHPQLGQVEIGGFLPGARVNPPDSLLPDLVHRHARFCAELARWLPQVELDSVTVKPLAEEVFRLSVRVRNQGYFPTVLAHAAQARAVKPTRIEIETEAQLLSGTRITFLDPVPGSRSAKAEWIVRGKKGQSVKITVIAEKAGTVRRVVRL